MGFLGPKDTSTPQERKAWSDRAQQQMDEQNGTTEPEQEEPDPNGPVRHRRRPA